MADHTECHRDLDRLLTRMGDLEDVVLRALGALNGMPEQSRTTEVLYARSILADALIYRIESARIDGCRCMCHSPNQPPLMVCVREGRCVLCSAQIDGSESA